MTVLTSPDIDPAKTASVVTRALRCWRRARDGRRPVLPRLSRLLKRDHVMLAPVLDSLFRFYAAALDRAPMVGSAGRVSDDERLLIALIERPDGYRKLNCGQGIAAGLGCALSSTRIMLARAL